jgi:hypothetical protein
MALENMLDKPSIQEAGSKTVQKHQPNSWESGSQGVNIGPLRPPTSIVNSKINSRIGRSNNANRICCGTVVVVCAMLLNKQRSGTVQTAQGC